MSFIEMFDGLRSLSTSTKEQLRDKITGFAVLLGELYIMRARVNQFVIFLFKISWRLAIILTIVFFAIRYAVVYSAWEWIGAVGLIFGGQYLLYSITILITSSLQSFFTSPTDTPYSAFLKFVWAFLFTNTFASFIYIYVLSWIYRAYLFKPTIASHTFALTAIAINPLIIYGCQILLTLISWMMSIILNRSQETKNPNAVIAALVVNVLYLLENYPNSWIDSEFKSFISSLIEKAARLIQHAMPKKLKSGDRNTDAWIKQDFSKIAAAIRDMKRAILVSNIKANGALTKRLATMFEYFVAESYDQLEHLEPNEKIHRFFIGQFVNYLWKLLLACIPLIIVLVFQNTKYALDGIFAQSLYFISVLNIVLSLISFNPQINENLAILREFTRAVKSFSGNDDRRIKDNE